MAEDRMQDLKRLLQAENAVRFAYLFGSRARGAAAPHSDFDVAVFVAEGTDAFAFRAQLLERINRALRTDRVDLIVLNEAPTVLRHRVIRDGVILKDDRTARVGFEARALRDYLDTAHLRKVYARGLKRRFLSGDGRG